MKVDSKTWMIMASIALLAGCDGGGGGGTPLASGSGYTSSVDTLITAVVRESDPGSADISLSAARLSPSVPIILGTVHASSDSCEGGTASTDASLLEGGEFTPLDLGTNLSITSSGNVVGALAKIDGDDDVAEYEGGVFVQSGVVYSVDLGAGYPAAELRSAGSFDVVWPDVGGGESNIRWNTDYDQTMLILAYTLYAEEQAFPIIKFCTLRNDGEAELELSEVRGGVTYSLGSESSVSLTRINTHVDVIEGLGIVSTRSQQSELELL